MEKYLEKKNVARRAQGNIFIGKTAQIELCSMLALLADLAYVLMTLLKYDWLLYLNLLLQKMPPWT